MNIIPIDFKKNPHLLEGVRSVNQNVITRALKKEGFKPSTKEPVRVKVGSNLRTEGFVIEKDEIMPTAKYTPGHPLVFVEEDGSSARYHNIYRVSYEHSTSLYFLSEEKRRVALAEIGEKMMLMMLALEFSGYATFSNEALGRDFLVLGRRDN